MTVQQLFNQLLADGLIRRIDFGIGDKKESDIHPNDRLIDVINTYSRWTTTGDDNGIDTWCLETLGLDWRKHTIRDLLKVQVTIEYP